MIYNNYSSGISTKNGKKYNIFFIISWEYFSRRVEIRHFEIFQISNPNAGLPVSGEPERVWLIPALRFLRSGSSVPEDLVTQDRSPQNRSRPWPVTALYAVPPRFGRRRTRDRVQHASVCSLAFLRLRRPHIHHRGVSSRDGSPRRLVESFDEQKKKKLKKYNASALPLTVL